MSGMVFPLMDNQARAVDPRDSVWLSASAGTGKTQVLSARVLRLLLQRDVVPAQILCLTFTKAGAAEMATRVNEVLASWVRMSPDALVKDLKAIGAGVDPDTQARARMLFARVLDCPGGGLRVNTIHAFSQWLLAAFPEEAGLVPGTKPMEDRDREVLAHRVLVDLLLKWRQGGDQNLLDALSLLSVRMGPDGARKWLMRCADARQAWFGPGSWQEPLDERVRQLIGLAVDAGPETVAALCHDDEFDCEALRRCLDILTVWDSKTGREGAAAIREWLALDPKGRAEAIHLFDGTLFNKTDGAPKQLNNILKRDASYGEWIDRVGGCVKRIIEHKTLLGLCDLLTPALTVGRRFAIAWEEAKSREGLIDFDDQIRRAANLLTRSDLAEWIRCKLDREFDHVLIDEAQDTNEAQWSIIRALTDDFFSGSGQRGDKVRTIFVVGDYKQAIFRFQGTSPENFATARRYYAQVMAERAKNARALKDGTEARELVELGLGRSYRTAQPVLDFVDAAIEGIGFANIGLDQHPGRHFGDDRPGLVRLWKPIDAAAPEDVEDDGPEEWLSEPEREMANGIARQVQAWLRDGFPLVKGKARNAGPGDIMVLVRKRRELAGLIVARLHAAGVPVAGVDRLRLGAPLAVKDLMAVLRFAVQPLDDLSLAALLVSPLIGWTQEQLLEHGYRPPNVALWDHLRDGKAPLVQETVERLHDLLRRADWEPPQALLQWLLVGPWQGRRKLVARLGREANDPIDELLNAALAFTSAHTPSLESFIHWFDAGEGELKREPGGGENLVRVMTVHGSKGLQAPIVILADATGNPDSSKTRGLVLEERQPGDPVPRKIPLPDLKAEQKKGRIAEADEHAAREEKREHWRLLYVAMTRAEEALFVGGALGKREKEPAADSWYSRLSAVIESEPVPDPVWGECRNWGKPAGIIDTQPVEHTRETVELPQWATIPVGPEPRPPRPLAPSSAGEELGADPPSSPDIPPDIAQRAARRGVLIHRLIERLPDVPDSEREMKAAEWLARNGADLPEDDRAEMLADALTVIRAPQWAELFSAAALPEVPLTAVVDGQVITGTVDRLLVEKNRVLVVDFKTARRPPADLGQVPSETLRQMAAYAAALRAIYPGRKTEAAVLYTHAPRLIAIPADVLDQHQPGSPKPGLTRAEESFAG